jgi:hypothetical protein
MSFAGAMKECRRNPSLSSLSLYTYFFLYVTKLIASHVTAANLIIFDESKMRLRNILLAAIVAGTALSASADAAQAPLRNSMQRVIFMARQRR